MLLAWLLTKAGSVKAEDIDLFKGGGAQDPSPPNVLIYLDNTSNWSANKQSWTKTGVTAKCAGDANCLSYVSQIFGNNASLVQGEVELAAIKLVINELVCNVVDGTPMKVNVGLMMLKPSKGTYTNNEGTSTSASGLGGLIRRSIAPLDTVRCATITSDLDTIFQKVSDPAWKAPADANYGGAMFDAFKYYGGHTNPAGAAGTNAGSPIGHISFGPKRYATPIDLEEASAFTDTTKLSFRSPITSPSVNSCGGRNYILLIGNGYPNSDQAWLLNGLGYTWANSQFADSSRGYLADVWARFLSTTDVSPVSGQQTVITSTLNVYNNAESTDQTALLKSMAKHGNGTYYEVGGNLGQLVDSLRNFFISINAANQSFAPSTLAPSTTSGGLDINQVYLGMFRPDKNPRWFGNLKLYQLVLEGTNANGSPNIYLGDTAGNAARSGSGFISDNAISFWTLASTFWTYRCGSGSSTGDALLCGSPISASDSPDGDVVEKGGAAQKLRLGFTSDVSNSARKIYTDNGSSRIDFNTTNITATQVGVSTTGERDTLVNWVRGVDNIGENTTASSGPRPSMTGDVLHSEPVAVNYGTSTGGCSVSAAGDVVVYYAGNDGMLHALSGGKTEGTELWSYIPADFLGKLKRLRDNAPAVTFPGPVPATSFNKPYLIDGNISVYAPDADGNCKPDKVWLFLTMRRGGRHIYALDVTNKSSPVFLWKRSSTDTGFSELGQTWSRLAPMMLPNGKLALIFGAGYDPAAEDRPFDVETSSYGNALASTRTMGRGVFAVTLTASGQIESTKFFSGGSYSFPSDVAVVSDVNTNIAERAYIGDTGGNLWRISLRDSATSAITADSSKWTMTQIASLGSNQKFLYPPDVARCGGQDVLLIGSGNREEPFDKAIPYRFYQIRDPATGVVGLTDLTNITTLGTQPDSSQKGWYFDLITGEKTVGSPVTQSGTTYFPTNVAASNSGAQCSTSLGEARLYGISCSTGGPSVYALDSAGKATARFETIAGGGFPPSPTTAVVKLTDKTSGQTKTIETVLSGSHVSIGKVVPTQRKFTYWYREGLD